MDRRKGSHSPNSAPWGSFWSISTKPFVVIFFRMIRCPPRATLDLAREVNHTLSNSSLARRRHAAVAPCLVRKAFISPLVAFEMRGLLLAPPQVDPLWKKIFGRSGPFHEGSIYEQDVRCGETLVESRRVDEVGVPIIVSRGADHN